jgi:hypothetical protein
MVKPFAVSVCLAVLALPLAARADGPIPVTLKDHKFSPAQIHVKANTVTLLSVTNADATADEFDSDALKVEKIIPANSTGIVRLRPLASGRYPFEGEYHADTAQGVVVAQ